MDMFEVVVIGIDQVERGMIIVLSARDKTIVVIIDIAWQPGEPNDILTQCDVILLTAEYLMKPLNISLTINTSVRLVRPASIQLWATRE